MSKLSCATPIAAAMKCGPVYPICPTCRARVCGGVFLELGRINLAERFGAKYQITYDGTHDPDEWGPGEAPRNRQHSLYMQIPCKFGTIYALGHGRLSVYIGDHYRVAGALSRIPGVVNCKKYTVPDDSGLCAKTFQYPRHLRWRERGLPLLQLGRRQQRQSLRHHGRWWSVR
jgi:hypothetical protein